MTPNKIAVFTRTYVKAMTLDDLVNQETIFAQIRGVIEQQLGVGNAFILSGDGDHTIIISLYHRDAPLHAARHLNQQQMSDLLAAFCSVRGLPFQSADEVLAKVFEQDAPCPSIINWLSAYIEAWEDDTAERVPA